MPAGPQRSELSTASLRPDWRKMAMLPKRPSGVRLRCFGKADRMAAWRTGYKPMFRHFIVVVSDSQNANEFKVAQFSLFRGPVGRYRTRSEFVSRRKRGGENDHFGRRLCAVAIAIAAFRIARASRPNWKEIVWRARQVRGARVGISLPRAPAPGKIRRRRTANGW